MSLYWEELKAAAAIIERIDSPEYFTEPPNLPAGWVRVLPLGGRLSFSITFSDNGTILKKYSLKYEVRPHVRAPAGPEYLSIWIQEADQERPWATRAALAAAIRELAGCSGQLFMSTKFASRF